MLPESEHVMGIERKIKLLNEQLAMAVLKVQAIQFQIDVLTEKKRLEDRLDFLRRSSIGNWKL